MQQAIKLLTLSNLEVEAFIAEEVEKNPLLDASAVREVATPERPEREAPAGADELVAGTAPSEDRGLDLDYATESHQQDSVADGGTGPDGGWLSRNGRAAGFDRRRRARLGFAGRRCPQPGRASEAQVALILSGTDLTIAAHIIDQLDEAGYLTVPLEEIAGRLGIPSPPVESVLKVVQSLDPTGVGARDLAECLALQAREVDRYDPCMAKLIANLDLLARGELVRLKRICGVDDETWPT